MPKKSRRGLKYRTISVLENGYSDQGPAARVLAPLAAVVGVVVLVVVAIPLVAVTKIVSPFARLLPRRKAN